MHKLFPILKLSLALIFALLMTLPAMAVITREQRLELTQVSGIIRKAGDAFKKQDFETSGKFIEEAQKRLIKLAKSGDAQLYRTAEPMFSRIQRAHALLELEGVSLAPFSKPAEPKPMAEPKPEPTPEPKPNPTPTDGISFVKDVAPILVNRCGRCHVTGARGDFSMANYTALMKGPPEGTVVFPGDAQGSRLIEVIASGSMPPSGNGIPRAELAKLAEWVTKGAKFDGPAPDAQLTSLSGNPAPQPVRTPPPTIRQATGKETVSFAKDIAPILIDNCSGCHIDAMRVQGGLNMDTFARLNRGGDTGPIVNAGDSVGSLLVRKLLGQEGNRMPAGGRPPLNDEQMKLITTWISEGATLDSGNPDQPLKVMASLAWARDASHEELMARRVEIATDNWKIGSPSEEAKIVETDNFYVVGSVGPNTLKIVSEKAEEALQEANAIIRKQVKPGEPFFRGRTSIFVFPRRYDYSEFGSMIEKRTLPTSWKEHWKYDGVDAYAALVVSPSDEDAQIKARLIAPLASLTLAQMGDFPHWMSDGVGRATAAKLGGQDFPAAQVWDENLPAALGSLTKPDQFLKKQLPPAQMDLLGYGIGKFLLDRSNKSKFDAFVRTVAAGAPFNTAFVQAFRGEPKDLVMAFGRWYASNANRTRRR